MPGKTQTQTDAVLDVLRGTNITAPANVYVGLFSANPANDASAGTELTGAGGYARQQVTFGAPTTDTGNVRKISNTGVITFGPATGSDWAQAVGFGIFDALTNGNLLYWDSLTTPKTVAVGDKAEFAVGALALLKPIAGTATSTSSAVAELFVKKVLAGSTLGQSSAVGTVIKTSGAAGAAFSTSSAVGNLLAQYALAGASAGVSEGVGTLAQAAGESSGTAVLARISPLAGSAVGTSSGTAALAVLWQLTGTTAGESSAIGNLSVVGPGAIIHELMGTAVSVSMATGTLSLTRPRDGAARGHSSLLLYWAGIPRSRSVGVR